MVQGLNPSGGKDFLHPARPALRAHPASSTMSTGSWPRVRWPGHGVDHPPPPSAKIKERVELYLYSPSVSSWQVIG